MSTVTRASSCRPARSRPRPASWMIRHRHLQQPCAPIDSLLMSEDPPAIAEPNDAAVRSAHEIAPLHLTFGVGCEDEIIAVEREGELQIARNAQPTIRGA